MGLDFNQLEIFVRVVTLKSFSRAAESMFLSQPTVSTRIKALEDELGVVLLDRSHPRELLLTREGQLVWDYAQRILGLRESLCRQIRKDEAVSGYLRVGASTVPGSYLLPRVLSGFKREYPLVRLNVSIKDTANITTGIVNFDYDLGMVGYRDDDPRLVFRELYEDDLILITCPGYLSKKGFSAGSAVSPSVFQEMDFILREPGSATRKVFEQALLNVGITLDHFKSVIYLDNMEAIKQAVRYGIGASVVSRLSVEDYLSANTVEGFKIAGLDLKRKFYAVFHRNRILSEPAELFLNALARTRST